MTITFNIHNVSYNLVKTVMLRKFFQMVFVGNDRKTLNIYTASVLGGCGSSEKDAQFNMAKYVSRLDKLKQFCMKFEFVVTGNDGNDVLSIISENITDQERGFLSQDDCIQQVWGKQCRVLYNSLFALQEKYNEFMPEEAYKDEKQKDETVKQKLALTAQKKVLWIQDKNKREPGMNAVAVAGVVTPEDYIRTKRVDEQAAERRRHSYDGSERAFYRVSVPEYELCKGMELLTWVKTTISFRYRLNDQNLNFCIKKGAEDDGTKFIAPDFTWYFSPPVKSFISYESSSAEVRWQTDNPTGKPEETGKKDSGPDECCYHDICKCPVKPEIGAPVTSKRYDNVVNPVANKTTVNFQRWTKDEMIGYRRKYRLASKNIFNRPEDFSSVEELNIFVDTTDEHSRGNRQYVLGIFISFALAFGIDKTRLGDAQVYFPFKQLFLADTWWLFMIIFMTLNLLMRPVRGIGKRVFVHWRRANIIISLMWIFAVFCVDRSEWLTGLFRRIVGDPVIQWFESWTQLNASYYVIPRAVFLIVLLSNAVYILWNIFRYHDPILSGLFDEDIL